MLRDFAAREFVVNGRRLRYYSLKALEEQGLFQLAKLPYSIRVFVENVLRNEDGFVCTDDDVREAANYLHGGKREVPFFPSRVLLQDFTGVPALVDLAAMRSAVKRVGQDPSKVNPSIPVDLVIDHSIQVDFFGTPEAFSLNLDYEFRRNTERYVFLKWAQNAFRNFRVIPPGRGIVHQVNLEYLAKVVDVRSFGGGLTAFPDTVLGTDSHTPMVNGLGVVGWGVGGIEAEAVMLGQPYYMTTPEVVGVRLVGELREGTTATDLVLTITEMLRKHGVVGKFVEFFGPSLSKLSVPDRATIANMAPEYGATIGYFPIDRETINYLRMTGRPEEHIRVVEEYAKIQGLFYNPLETPVYNTVLELDLSTVEPSISGPANPEDRIPLREAKRRTREIMLAYLKQAGIAVDDVNEREWSYEGGAARASVATVQKKTGSVVDGLSHGSVVISAITSCTNTSNPSVMIGAGLLAKKAVEKGLRTPSYVKTSLAPGSMAVTEYLEKAGLAPYLEKLGYSLVGYGCTTCIGNSGPLPEHIVQQIKERNLYTVAVLSGNRNFEGRINPHVRASYLMSPMLVVAYGLAGRIDIDMFNEPLGIGSNGQPVYLRDIWPSLEEIKSVINQAVTPELFIKKYADILKGEERWERLPAPVGEVFQWDEKSTYVREPPYFINMPKTPREPEDIADARVLILVGDRITTDHISPAGAIPVNSPAGKYLIEQGVDPVDFNTYGARRGNHEVMIRGTFANIRLKNLLVEGKEGWWTVYHPTGEVTTVYDAAMRYREAGVPLIVLAGKMYGAGSSRDWAAKGTRLLGVRAVIAESYERIHRSNLVGMGVLPLQFMEGEGWRQLGLTGRERYTIRGISEGLTPGKKLTVEAVSDNGEVKKFNVITRLDTKIEVEYYRHGGILQYVLRRIMSG
ncbi:aconitate hydratase [Candidatus Caldarchaeum subterraneum]|uniref:aconitate hydratase n=1 Tax=Caldiarchaeum subterraneum TaxID=311458 RepID=E6N649_CALS0|nr:aconitate hydratase [Candidatus Caldarchaeum subterraneum]BAJ50637.1 aconitate hydratase [Candidatus Caldarchaeum subterraneum]